MKRGEIWEKKNKFDYIMPPPDSEHYKALISDVKIMNFNEKLVDFVFLFQSEYNHFGIATYKLDIFLEAYKRKYL